jgi:demethylmenaquinone methyltransferase/2-methoxy-6-polyprenyl-1,4-benzoquinol methylase
VSSDRVLAGQLEYYRARAPEYDEWFFRTGRYDRGPQHREAWLGEVAAVEAALRGERLSGDVLELACGTGLWTRHLASMASHVVAVDGSREVLAINRQRVQSDHVDYVEADLFQWQPAARFDAVFFGFWLSHVPQDRFDAFWTMVGSAVRPGGRVFFVDSLFEPASTSRDHAPIDRSGVVRRRLNDGRAFDVVKVFHEPATLERRLAAAGWTGRVRSTGRFFLYAALEPPSAAPRLPALPAPDRQT